MTRALATFDPLHLGAGLELERSNTVLTHDADSQDAARTVLGTVGKSSGVSYVEWLVWGDGDIDDVVSLGVATADASLTTILGGDAHGYGYRPAEGELHNSGADITSGAIATATKGQIVSLLLDCTGAAPRATWSLEGEPIWAQDLAAGTWYPAVSLGGAEAYDLRVLQNAGQRGLEYAPGNVTGWLGLRESIGMFRIADAPWLTAPDDDPPNTRYRGDLLPQTRTSLRRSLHFALWGDAEAGSTQVSSGDLLIADEDGWLDVLLERDARGAQVRVLHVPDGGDYGDATVLADLSLDDVAVPRDSEVQVSVDDPIAELIAAPLQTRLIRPDAAEASADTLWPISYGAVRSIEPPLIDGPNRTYALHDGLVLGLAAIRTSGDALDPTAVPPDYTLDERGMLVLDTDPVGRLTADVSSVGGQLPGTLEDLLEGTGDFSDPDDWVIAAGDEASSVTGGKLQLRRDSQLGVVAARHATWTPTAGKTYRIRVTLDAVGATGIPGTSLVWFYVKHGDKNGSTQVPNEYGYPNTQAGAMIRTNQPGTYDCLYTQWTADDTTFWLQLPVAYSGSGTLGTAFATVSKVEVFEVNLDPVDDESLVPIKLEDLLREIFEGRRRLLPSAWSSSDAALIDTLSGYAGVGLHARTATTMGAALRAVLDSYHACLWRDASRKIRVSRLRPPEDESTANYAGTLTHDDLLADLRVETDRAPGLSTQAVGRKNWTVLKDDEIVSDTDPVTGVPLAFRAMLTRDYRISANYAGTLSARYAPAIYAKPMETLLDKRVDVQAHVDYAGYMYRSLRRFTTWRVAWDPADPTYELDQVWLLKHPRYGFADGVPGLLVGLDPDPIALEATLMFWS